MGFLTKPDSIGALTYSSGVITLQPSRLTIGGQQYRVPTLNVALSGLTANSLYMVFVVMTGPSSFQLVVSANYNSVGPAGYTKWKLVKAFYASAPATLGAFINDLYSTPQTDFYAFTPTGAWNTNVVYEGETRRDGDVEWYSVILSFTGNPSPATFSYLNLRSGRQIDFGKIAGAMSVPYVKRGVCSLHYGPASVGVIVLSVGQQTIVIPQRMIPGSPNITYDTYTNSVPTAIVNGNSMSIEFDVPIVGWSSTPIAYL